jgi:2-polyprenyl-3-methyl-5-hydroxy-6-metoxy-1,4-benzoquinol methylase
MELTLLRRLVSTTKWDEVYRKIAFEEMPWFSRNLDHDIEKALTELKITKGNVLDIGTGPGTQAIALAKRGFQVTGTDISETAVRKAAERAQNEGAKVTFMADNILDSYLEDKFNFVIDRGCFHTINPPQRSDYILIVHSLIKTRGYLFLKCFSHKEPAGPGPHRIKPQEITELFEPLFKIHSIKESSFKGTLDHAPKALFCILQKRAK